MEILNVCAVRIRASKNMKQKMDRLQWIKTYNWRFQHISLWLIVVDRKSGHGITKQHYVKQLILIHNIPVKHIYQGKHSKLSF